MSYQFWGLFNAALVLLSAIGIYQQLRRVLTRKADSSIQQPTAILSLNQFTASFWAYFSFYLFGASLPQFDHYLVWPRLIASVLVLCILWQIYRDRHTKASGYALILCGISLMLGLVVLPVADQFLWWLQPVSSVLIVLITCLLAQGYGHQIYLIYKSRQTGAVDIRMSQFILIKDISTIGFALVLGVEQAWPLLLLASVSAMTKIIILIQFRWVRALSAAS